MLRPSPETRARWAPVFSIDLRTLALFRVALASVVFVDLWRRLFLDLRAFHTDWGFLPRDWLVQSDSLWRVDLYLVSGDAWFAAVLLLLSLAAAAALAVGYRTRWAAVLTFVLVVSVQNRNPLVLIGGDTLITCLLFWTLFVPLGARWSVDATLSTTPPPADNRHVSWGTAGLLLQVMSVYFFSAWLKNGADWWPDGLAVYYTLQLDRYATRVGHWLAQFPDLMQALSYYVYFLEWFGPVLVFLPWQRASAALRFVVMLAFMLLHVGFIFCIEIGHFPFVSLASLTVLLGGWFWDWAGARLDRGRRIRIFYDRDCGFCIKSCRLLQTFLVLPRAEITPAQDNVRAAALMQAHYSWVVIDEEDRAHIKWAAFVALLRHSLLLRWLYPLAALHVWTRPGDVVYDFVGRHRGVFSRLTGALLPQREEVFATGPTAQGIAGLFVFLVLAWNLASVDFLPDAVLRPLAPVFRPLRLDQGWSMFAPYPTRTDGWTVFPGTLEDGSEVDVLRPGAAPDWQKPRHIPDSHENVRWHTYRWRLLDKAYAGHRLYYGKYLCRDWNATAPPGRRLLKFNMTWVQEFSVPPGETPKLERYTGWWHECVADEPSQGSKLNAKPPAF